MELINPDDITELEKAQDTIKTLQERLLAREQALDDLARAVEIAEITKQFQLVTSFREAAETMLQDRIVIPSEGEDQDLKVRIYE
jgi:hypothetical protein